MPRSRGGYRYLQSAAGQKHRMLARTKIRATELCDTDGAPFPSEAKLNDSVNVACARTIVRSDHEGRAPLCRKTEKRLGKTVILERIAGEIPELSKTIHVDPPRICVLDGFRNVLADWLAFHFCS